jgi:hypothetical protein
MTKKLMGLFAAVALMGSGAAFANDQAKKQETQQTQQGAMGGSGSMGSSATGQMENTTNPVANQLTGRVVKNDKKTLYIEHAGAIVPLKVDKNTVFSDPSIKRVQDLKEGDEIRASFEVRKTDNVATSIQKSSAGMGGSGTEVNSPDSSLNPSPGTMTPSQEGTGGSGTDLNTPDINKDNGSDINKGANPDLGTGVNSDSSKTSGDY